MSGADAFLIISSTSPHRSATDHIENVCYTYTVVKIPKKVELEDDKHNPDS